MSTSPICTVSTFHSTPVPAVRENDGARSEVGSAFSFRVDGSEDYAYLFFLYNVVNSHFSTVELHQWYESMGASFRSFLLAGSYSQALEAPIGDLLLTHFVPLINSLGERGRQLSP